MIAVLGEEGALDLCLSGCVPPCVLQSVDIASMNQLLQMEQLTELV